MYKLSHYLAMSIDPVRLRAYGAALSEAIRPNDVVLDLGAGTGAITWLALKAGAKHVHAVDNNPAVEVLRAVALKNGFESKVTVHYGDATKIDIPRVDVIVYDIRGASPFLGNNLDVLQVCRTKCLKEGGRVIPLQDTVWAAPIVSPALAGWVSEWDRAWGDAEHQIVGDFAANTASRCELRPSDLLGEPQELFSVDYQSEVRAFTGCVQFVVQRSSLVTGFGLWFDARLTENIWLSTRPENGATVYGQLFLPIRRQWSVRQGELVNLRLSVHCLPHEPVWRWWAHRAADQEAQWEGSTLNSMPIPTRAASVARPTFVPRAGRSVSIERDVLNLIDGTRNNQEIASSIARQHPTRFRDWIDALALVTSIVNRLEEECC